MAWRDSGLRVNFFGLDGLSLVPLLLFLLHMGEGMFYFLILSIAFLQILARRGWTATVLFYVVRRKICGDFRPVSRSLRTYRRRARW